MNPAPRKFTIGRDKNCDVPIADDSVSRQHAELRLVGEGSFSIADLKSSNGTVLIRQGRPKLIREESLLPNDRLRFGSVELSVKELIDALSRKYPDLSNKEVAGGDSRAHPSETKLVRCGCGAIKQADQRCPSCGE